MFAKSSVKLDLRTDTPTRVRGRESPSPVAPCSSSSSALVSCLVCLFAFSIDMFACNYLASLFAF